MLWVVCWDRFAGLRFLQRVRHYCGSVLWSRVDLELVCKRLRSARTWGFREKIQRPKSYRGVGANWDMYISFVSLRRLVTHALAQPLTPVRIPGRGVLFKTLTNMG